MTEIGQTRVGDLIAGARWMPPRSKLPLVSILLPTFQRAGSGHLKRCIETLLIQSFTDFELIVVDDASVDGSANLISEFCALDGRIGVIQHHRNIGLPAISTWEALCKARGELIFFAFDDNEFLPQALEGLVSELLQLNAEMVVGHIDMHLQDTYSQRRVVIPRLGVGIINETTLRSHNFIPNNAVLIRRRVFDAVGWYDPHIVIARLCDWDLWRRIARRFRIQSVNVAVGTEHGPLLSDSLGRSYAMDPWAIAEWTSRENREDALRIENYALYDVAAWPQHCSARLRDAIVESLQRHPLRAWGDASDAKLVYPRLLVVSSPNDEYLAQYFCGDARLEARVRIVDPAGWGWQEIIGAQAVIFVGSPKKHRLWIASCSRLNIPVVLFPKQNDIANDHVSKEFDDVDAYALLVAAGSPKPSEHNNVIEFPAVGAKTSTGASASDVLNFLVTNLPPCGLLEREQRYRRVIELTIKFTGIPTPLAGRASIWRVIRHRVFDPLNIVLQQPTIAKIARSLRRRP